MKQSKLSPEKELESLKAEIEKIDKTRRGIKDRINALEDKVWEPFFRKKYVGKYFKFNNSVSSVTKPFWIYFHVTGIDGVQLLVNKFGESPFGGHSFNIQYSVVESTLEKKITKREWDRELNKFLGNVKKLK